MDGKKLKRRERDFLRKRERGARKKESGGA